MVPDDDCEACDAVGMTTVAAKRAAGMIRLCLEKTDMIPLQAAPL